MSDDFRTRDTLMDGCCWGARGSCASRCNSYPAQVTLRLKENDLRRCRRVRRHVQTRLGVVVDGQEAAVRERLVRAGAEHPGRPRKLGVHIDQRLNLQRSIQVRARIP